MGQIGSQIHPIESRQEVTMMMMMMMNDRGDVEVVVSE